MKMLEESATWREEFCPERISPDDIEVEARTAKMYFKGFTKQGYPVIYMRPGRDTNDDNDLKFKYLVYTPERAVAHLYAGVDYLCWLIDFKGFSTKLTGMSNL
eukprot:EC723953.1.p1 GENE.EC723953.1~~EC723953.1.p1  ORF type:complete len:103 (+),score=11.65 EC723953.1:213-521(+)